MRAHGEEQHDYGLCTQVQVSERHVRTARVRHSMALIFEYPAHHSHLGIIIAHNQHGCHDGVLLIKARKSL